jgi:hypothetical protein
MHTEQRYDLSNRYGHSWATGHIPVEITCLQATAIGHTRNEEVDALDTITAATMRSLVDHRSNPSVSLYMPTHRAGQETQQDPIQLRNLLDRAQHELTEAGNRSPDARELLKPARRLIDESDFWRHQEDGLALFLSPERMETFRLPQSFGPFVNVATGFHVKPLWPIVGGDLFYVLALSRNQIRLLWSDRYRIGNVALPPDTPKSLAEALWYDDSEKQLQHHVGMRTGRDRGVAVFHGHGSADQPDVAKLEKYLRAIDHGVRTLIDPESLLVIAGAVEIASRYRKVSGHPSVVEQIVAGNPEHSSADQLRRRAAGIVEPLMTKAVVADAEIFLAAGKRAVSTVEQTVAAALTGRVATLFIPIGVQAWGQVHNGAVTRHDERMAGDRDLLDLAGAATWSTGGAVYAREPDEIPGKGRVAATLRY